MLGTYLSAPGACSEGVRNNGVGTAGFIGALSSETRPGVHVVNAVVKQFGEVQRFDLERLGHQRSKRQPEQGWWPKSARSQLY